MSSLKVGFSRVVMNPEESVPLAGYCNENVRFSKQVIDDLCATSVAITDKSGSTVLLMSVDSDMSYEEPWKKVREMICQETGLDEDRIWIAGCHSHSAPSIGRSKDVPSIIRYTKLMIQRMYLSAMEALADRLPARMFISSVEAEGMNFVKHYRAKDIETGEISYIGDQFGTRKKKIILDHATKADPTMHLVRFVREGGKDVIIANWRAHPQFTGGYHAYDVSSDFIGTFRLELEAMTDCHAVYFQGACGNLNATSYVEEEMKYKDHRSFGKRLAEYAVEGLAKSKEVLAGEVKNREVVFPARINHSLDHLYGPASEMDKVWDESFDLNRCVEMGKPYGIRSIYQAFAIIGNYESGETLNMTLKACTIGDKVAFVSFPGELFDTISAGLEEQSPYERTLLIGYCHHHVGYLPSSLGFSYTSYETDTTRMAPGTGEDVQIQYVRMLDELKYSDK